MNLPYSDSKIAVAIKPSGLRSTDEPGQFPDRVRLALGDPLAPLRTVHRLDQVVGGLMVLARTAHAASDLSRQIRDGQFTKEYLAVIHGRPPEQNGTLRDLLQRDRARRRTVIAPQPGPDAREAVLHYQVIAAAESLSLVRIQLVTGRTHQIRVQFSSRGLPLVGDQKYSPAPEDCPIALWSCHLAFLHPKTGQPLDFTQLPPPVFPWNLFDAPLGSLF